MECWTLSMTNTCEGYTWRSFGKYDCKVHKLHMECQKNLNLKFVEILSTPCHGAVDQDWRSKLHALLTT